MRDWGCKEVSAMDVYSDIFHLGEGLIQKEGQEKRDLKSNPIAYWKNQKDQKGHYRIMFDDTFQDVLKELQDADFSILNGITYFGRKNLQASANKMYCLIFDLDGVTDETINNFMSGAVKAEAYPIPNYVILSGHGVHLYYLFEDPVPLYPNIKIQLKSLKYALTEKMWNMYTSKDDRKQFQGINQGFRVIGGKTKIDGVRVRAFRMHSHPFTLSQLSEYVPEESRVDESKIWKESKITLNEAKRLYPDWYQKRVVEGSSYKGHWTCKRDLYDWWKRQIREGATFHHRYFNVMCLSIYAVKSGIEWEELRSDAVELIPYLNNLAPADPFTMSDVLSALECFDERYVTFPIEDISKLSGIQIKKNKRNGRRRADHIRLMNFVRDEINHTDWRNKNGRPMKEAQVKEWRRTHPEGSISEASKQLGISRTTAYKYWNT